MASLTFRHYFDRINRIDAGLFFTHAEALRCRVFLAAKGAKLAKIRAGLGATAPTTKTGARRARRLTATAESRPPRPDASIGRDEPVLGTLRGARGGPGHESPSLTGHERTRNHRAGLVREVMGDSPSEISGPLRHLCAPALRKYQPCLRPMLCRGLAHVSWAKSAPPCGATRFPLALPGRMTKNDCTPLDPVLGAALGATFGAMRTPARRSSGRVRTCPKFRRKALRSRARTYRRGLVHDFQRRAEDFRRRGGVILPSCPGRPRSRSCAPISGS